MKADACPVCHDLRWIGSARCICNPKPKPWIVAAANKMEGGLILVGARHWDELMRAQAKAAGVTQRDHEIEQGFIDQNRDFHTREEAWKIAEANGQIKFMTGARGTLYSEDLY